MLLYYSKYEYNLFIIPLFNFSISNLIVNICLELFVKHEKKKYRKKLNASSPFTVHKKTFTLELCCSEKLVA